MKRSTPLISKFLAGSELGLRAESLFKDLLKSNDSSHIALGFNGGKDSAVVFFLTQYFLEKFRVADRVKYFYFREATPLTPIENYIRSLSERFGLSVIVYQQSGGQVTDSSMKSGLARLISEHKVTHLISGTRRSDPFCANLTPLAPTDTHLGWPQAIRVMPIIDWSYHHVWAFLRGCELDYCPLYDQGFTYLGDREQTMPNPFLKGRPAWQGSENIEIFGRTKFYNGLERQDGRLVIKPENVIFLAEKGTSLPPSQKIRDSLADFCEKNGLVLSGIQQPQLEELQSGETLDQAVMKAVVKARNKPEALRQLCVFVRTARTSEGESLECFW